MIFIKTALSIAGSDSIGGAGIQADIKTMISNGVYAMTVITAVTSQNTLGVSGIFPLTSQFVEQQIDSVFTDIIPNAVKTGMLFSEDIIVSVAEKLKFYKAENIVCDPVMVSTSGSKLIDENAVSAVKKYLFPISALVTPNIPESEALSGIHITNADTMLLAAKMISENFGCAVLLKGGHCMENADDLLYSDGTERWFRAEKINNSNTHGTGCTLSSAIAANLAKGYDIEKAVEYAKKYITGAINAGLDIGRGNGSLDHGYDLKSEFIQKG